MVFAPLPRRRAVRFRRAERMTKKEISVIEERVKIALQGSPWCEVYRDARQLISEVRRLKKCIARIEKSCKSGEAPE